MPRTRRPGAADSAEESLFHRKHLFGLFWTLVAAAVAFVAGQWYSGREGPQKVYVTNVDTTQRVVAVGDTAARRYLHDLVTEMRDLRRSQSRGKAVATLRQSPPGDTSSATTASPAPVEPNPPQLPPLPFPSLRNGYLVGTLAGIASSQCPSREQHAGSEIATRFDFRSSSTLKKVTPVFVRLTTTSADNRAIQIFEQQYEPRVHNRLQVALPTAPGDYVLEFGVYLWSELDRQYPTYYRTACRVMISQ